MKSILPIITLSLLCGWTANAAEPVSAQDQQVLAIVKEIQAQQQKIAENQAGIDAKLASVTEAVRQARIFATRPAR